MEFGEIESWDDYKGAPYVIAGPCSAETEEQVMDTARQLAANGRVSAFRAGIWKPRTRPGGFAGLGEVALPWLARVEKETTLKAITEVARPEHIELALKAGLRQFWIGARTTVNPFLVQELADALKGTGVRVWVKNPVSQDLGLWIGAIERFAVAGIKELGAIHRGFSQYEKGLYRNPPEWQIAIALKSQFPTLPLLCDPSHITGNSDLVGYVAQAAMDLDYDGLIIETHPNPPAALSDAAQQITPAALEDLLYNLEFRKMGVPSAEGLKSLQALRHDIDELDTAWIENLSKRFEKVAQLGYLKKDEQILVLQIERWRQILRTRLAKARHLGLDETFIVKLLELIHAESIRRQDLIVNVRAERVVSQKS